MKFLVKVARICAASILMVLASQPLRAEFIIDKVRYWSAPDHTRVVFDATAEPDFKGEEKEGELILHFPSVSYSPSLKPIIKLAKPGVKSVSLEQNRIRIFLNEYKEVKVFKLSPIEDKPHRLVVDVYLPEKEKREVKEEKRRTIVIDPGHGGDDPGAIGVRGAQEKEVVLSVAQKIRDIINQKKGFRAVLTREGDYYVPFRKRMRIARDNNAELFLSLHADAEKAHLARGASVYVLSLRGASSEAARILARKENLADIIGGTMLSESMKNGESESILLNMVQTNNLNKSRQFALSLLRTIETCHRLKFPRVQEAPFLVLKLPEIPSVLVELGYISNPREERLLTSEKFQNRVARAIAGASISFLMGRKVPKLEVKKEEVKEEEKTYKGYRVQKGDTWTALADRCGISVGELRRINEKKPLVAGREIKVPAQGCLKRHQIIYYRVKKGDTLDKIARRHKIQVEDLRDFNKNRRLIPLYMGDIIVIPRR